VRALADTRSTYQSLFATYLPVALAVFAIVVITLVFVGVRCRARPGRDASDQMTAPRLEMAYIALLAVIAAALLWRSYEAIADVDPGVPARSATGVPTLTIGVVASQWNWTFTYPGGVAQTGNGRERYPVLVVPTGRDVRFRLTSQDVVHAFWIPALRAKYDAMPGYVNIFDLRFERGLDYTTSRCSEFCGAFHDQMQFRVRLLAPAAFDAWLRGRRTGAAT
jgi:cytochrome c oxidase subunit II